MREIHLNVRASHREITALSATSQANEQSSADAQLYPMVEGADHVITNIEVQEATGDE